MNTKKGDRSDPICCIMSALFTADATGKGLGPFLDLRGVRHQHAHQLTFSLGRGVTSAPGFHLKPAEKNHPSIHPSRLIPGPSLNDPSTGPSTSVQALGQLSEVATRGLEMDVKSFGLASPWRKVRRVRSRIFGSDATGGGK